MKIHIYGCRGSIARSHPNLHRYGGNTSCVEVESSTGTRIVLDMGSGAYDLGQKLVRKGPLRDQHVLLSHSHWDHIQGFPFFVPLFIKGSEWNIYAPGGFSTSLKDKLSSQMSHEFFPLTIEQLAADINYRDLKEGELELGDFHVTTQYINHTVLTLGYRLESKTDGTSMAYITDHEMFNHDYAQGYKRTEDGGHLNADDRHADFFRGVDLLIHDTQYLASEYKTKEGWGHATVECIVDMAMSVGVKKLALFHHDPLRTDDEIDEILVLAQERVKAAGGTLQVIAAADFSTVPLERDPNASELTTTQSWTCATQPKVLPEAEESMEDSTNGMDNSALTQVVDTNLEVVVSHSNPDLFQELAQDGFQVTHMAKGQPFLQSVPQRKPSLILVQYDNPSKDNFLFKNCQRLREEFGAWGKDVPYLVLVKNQAILDDVRERGDAAGVTDWVVEPCSPAYIRTRIRMGISRNPCKWKPPLQPNNESQRLQALQSLQILDSSPEERFDRITKLCAAVFAVPLVFVSLIDENRQWFKSAQWLCPMPDGPKPTETSREVSFCGHTILQDGPLIIPDTTQDDRFAQNPFVADADCLKIRFYAGVPLSVPNVQEGGPAQFKIGTLCILDQRPRDLDESQTKMLEEFAEMVKSEIMTFVSRKLASSRPSSDHVPILKPMVGPTNSLKQALAANARSTAVSTTYKTSNTEPVKVSPWPSHGSSSASVDC